MVNYTSTLLIAYACMIVFHVMIMTFDATQQHEMSTSIVIYMSTSTKPFSISITRLNEMLLKSESMM